MGVHMSRQLETFPKALQNGAKEVARVEKSQRYQHQVESVPHFLGRQDHAGPKVGQNPSDGKRGLDDPFQPEAEVCQDFIAAFVVPGTPDLPRTLSAFT